MGDGSLGATSWADAGHRIGRLVRDTIEAGHAFLIVDEPGGRYVQMHAHPGGGCWVEADSGAYSVPLAAAQHRALLELGWPPVDDEHAPTGNYGLDVEPPVDVYRLVLLLARTFTEVYGVGPDGLTHVASACRCEQS